MTRRLALLHVLVGSIAVIAGALLFEHVGGLTPCELCLLERWPYYIGIPVTLAALVAGERRVPASALIAVVALLFVASSGLAFYHVGVEQHWFRGPTACTGGSTAAQTIEELRAQLLAQQPVRCDEPQWTLFGISLAGWNLVASIMLTGFALVSLGGARRRRA